MKVKKLSDEIHKHLLGYAPTPWTRRAKEQAQDNWEKFGLQDATDPHEIVEIPIPDGVGSVNSVLDLVRRDHGYYIERLEAFYDHFESQGLPLLTDSFQPLKVSGWQRYTDSGWRVCEIPDVRVAILDFETVEVRTNEWMPICCGMLSPKGIYLWQANLNNLQPVAQLGIKDCVIIGANVSYDRSFIASEYAYRDDCQLDYYDTQSAWIVTRGFSNQQRSLYKKSQEDDYLYAPWTDETATNGLDEVYKFYTGKTLDKSVRDCIIDKGLPWVRDNLTTVSWYCVKDLSATLEVFLHLYPEHKQHRTPLNLLSTKLMGKAWLPLSSSRFPVYYQNADRLTEETLNTVRDKIRERITSVLDQYCPYRGITDEELPIEAQRTKTATQKAKRQWLKDNVLKMPEVDDPWLQQLDWTIISTGSRRGFPKWTDVYKSKISLECRSTLLLLGVTWRGYPIMWDEVQGWTANGEMLPHPKGKDPKTKEPRRVTEIFVKGYESAVENGLIGGQGDIKDVLERIMSTVNWISLKKRVAALKVDWSNGYPVTLPRWLVTGTATGRAADNVWQVASNPKAKRIGTELKSMVEPPKGYCFVGADVDGQEIGLAGSLGDATIGYQGATALGLMCIIGDKKQKTDPHNVVAREVGVTRDISKNNLVFAALYGQGLSGTYASLLTALPQEPEHEVKQKAVKFLTVFKGTKSEATGKYVNGLASEAFNVMEQIADSPQPKTPVLGAALTKALAGVKDFATTRRNFPIQASGTDYKDLLVLLADYFYKRLGVDGRLLITIHDEIRTVVNLNHRYLAAYALQLAHLYTRAFIVDHLALDCIPAGAAYFSAVDIDPYCLRKDPSDPQLTPSQTEPIPPGEELNLKQILERLSLS